MIDLGNFNWSALRDLLPFGQGVSNNVGVPMSNVPSVIDTQNRGFYPMTPANPGLLPNGNTGGIPPAGMDWLSPEGVMSGLNILNSLMNWKRGNDALDFAKEMQQKQLDIFKDQTDYARNNYYQVAKSQFERSRHGAGTENYPVSSEEFDKRFHPDSYKNLEDYGKKG